MTTTDEWEDVVAAPGNWMKWETVGDQLTGWVVAYDPAAGATTFDGDVCGLLVLDDHDTRELHSVSLDKGALKDAVAAASPHTGLLLRIQYDTDLESKNGRTYKHFKVQKNTASKPPERPVSDLDETPF